MPILPGYSLKHHAELVTTLKGALADRTWRNKLSHVTTYVNFCKLHGVTPASPRVYDLLSFLLYLSKKLRSYGAICNYFSSVKLWVSSGLGDHSAFKAYELTLMKKGLRKSSSHVTIRAYPIAPEFLLRIITSLSSLVPVPAAAIAALLLGYVCLLRQSNLVVTSKSSPHVLRFKDIVAYDHELVIKVRSSKTRHSSRLPLVYKIPATRGKCCPVAAWFTYLSTVNPRPSDPAFLLPDLSPLTAKLLTKVLRTAASAILGCPIHVTLHSLRRGAAQACARSGLSLPALTQAGTWSSSAYQAYLDPLLITEAPSALAYLLGER